ncbi:MAG: hypothetical protein ACRC92_26725 [Peptostreptococcaceae bacterium]
MNYIKMLQNKPHSVLDIDFVNSMINNSKMCKFTLYSYIGVIYMIHKIDFNSELFDDHNVNVFCDKIYDGIKRYNSWFDDEDEVMWFVKTNLLSLEVILKFADNEDAVLCASTVKCMLLDLVSKTLNIRDDSYVIKRIFDKPPSEFYGYFR